MDLQFRLARRAAVLLAFGGSGDRKTIPGVFKSALEKSLHLAVEGYRAVRISAAKERVSRRALINKPLGGARLAALLDLAQVIIRDPNGRITHWSAAAQRLYGWSRDQALGEVSHRLLSTEFPKPLPEIEAGLSDAGRWQGELIQRTRDGHVVHVVCEWALQRDAAGQPIAVIEVNHDITERKKADEARSVLAAIVESSDEAIIGMSLDGFVTTWNRSAEDIFGYRAEEIVGYPVTILYPRDRVVRENRILNRIKRGERVEHYETVRCRKDGGEIAVSITISPIRDAAGFLLGAAKIVRDISARKRAEAAFKSLNESLAQQVEQRINAHEKIEDQLRQSQKMEAIGQLTGGIAHDFNNLLTVVSGNLEVLEDLVGRENPRAHRLINMARQGTARTARLTAQLLAFSRQQRLQPETLSLKRLLDDFRGLIERAVGDTVEVGLDSDPGLWLCRVDPAQFQSAILNLAVNARDAMPNGGQFTVETRNIEVDGDRVDYPLEIESGPYVRVSVIDTGDGIPADMIGKIFEPFFTTKDIGKGTGLGLSQVYGFVRQSEGIIAVESDVGRGATFRIYLPKAADSEASQVSHQTRTSDEPLASDDALMPDELPKGSETILVVEDDLGVLDLLLTSLTGLGYQVVSARDGNEAFEILRGPQAECIDLLLTDILMPRGLSGVGLAQTARELQPGIQVILMTGYASGDRLASEGAADLPLLVKPFRQADLARKLRVVLDETGTQ